MTLNIVMFFDARLAVLGDHTAAIARSYAEQHGHRFHCYRSGLVGPEHHVYWNKIAILIQELGKADLTLWLDADVLLVGMRPLEDLVTPSDITVSRDKDGLCCGVLLARNTDWVRSFLQAWLLLGDVDSDEVTRYERNNLRDQTALKCLVANFPGVRERIASWPEHLVLNPRAEFSEAPVLMHYWSSSGRLMQIKDSITSFRRHGWQRDCFLRHPDCTSPGAHALGHG